MRATIFCLTALVAVAAPRTAVHAQSAPAAVGERVRVATAMRYGKFSYVGRVVPAQGDSLGLEIGGPEGTQAIPLSAITRVEVSAGTETHGRRGMLYGSVIGGVAGAVIGAASYKDPGTCSSGETFFCIEPNGGRGLDTVAGFITGGLLGLAAGGIIGVTHRTERWVRRPLGSGGRVGITPVRGGGATVAVTMRF